MDRLRRQAQGKQNLDQKRIAQLKHCGGITALFLFFLFLLNPVKAQESNLAILNGGVQKSEDAPFVSSEYRFMPGDYIHFTFHVAGFTVQSDKEKEVRKIALSYLVTVEDLKGVPLAPSDTGSIETELSSEDKSWTPKRRSSFLLPSFVASGEFQVRVVVKDLLAKTEVSKSFPFHIGGVVVAPTTSVTIQNLQFFRREEDRESLEVPAYAPGDTVNARFNFTGFQLGSENTYHLSYGILVRRPDGKPYLQQPNAAELQAGSYYPAQYLPGAANITTSANSSKGQYTVIITVHDLIGKTSHEVKTAFSLE
ncbi:MAG: hypothetical protein JO182_13170 [Acidobacteriaceae bacterium]|nr:hypothetical protein [Acidobacteriaceae bacterium]